jgi:serine/threonine protein phosphatase 1
MKERSLKKMNKSVLMESVAYNIIADVAGRYEELLALINRMPKNKIILVGDLVDRGFDSCKVIEWAMHNPNVITLKGNHEDMMVEAFYGNIEGHVYNGGKMTLQSYGIFDPADYPHSHIEWMENLPLCAGNDKLFVSHAPWLNTLELGEVVWEHQALWNREPPARRKGVFQVFGHNHIMEKYDDYAMCIDDCGHAKLTGLVWPSMEIYQEDYR